MKELTFEKLENINGGSLSGRDCLLRGIGVLGSIAAIAAGQLWGIGTGTVLLATSGDCF